MKYDYLKRLSWEARWHLPKREAETVMEDYREKGCSETQLYQDFGTPKEAVRLLVRPLGDYSWNLSSVTGLGLPDFLYFTGLTGTGLSLC